MPRSILHIDLDAFYAAVEVLDNPTLKGKPVIVGGPSNRGVVSAASYEARKFGVRSAMAISRARRLCPQGVYLPVRMSRYVEMSQRVFAIYDRFTPLVEPLSIDEAFLDITGCERLFGNAEDTARKIKQTVLRETGLIVSVGCASNKFVAKIASDEGKPDGLVVVPPGKEQAFLDPLPVSRVWGVGKVTEKELDLMGIRTIEELRLASEETLVRTFGSSGAHLFALARGIDDRPVETESVTKSIGHEETYGRDLQRREMMRRELLSLSHRVAQRLRNEGFRGKTVTLKVKYADFVQITRAITLLNATDDGGTIYRCVLDLLEETEAGARPVRLLGVSASKLSQTQDHVPDTRMEQIPLFGPRMWSCGVTPDSRNTTRGGGAGEVKPLIAILPDPSKKERINKAVDAIREKFGQGGIVHGALPPDEKP